MKNIIQKTKLDFRIINPKLVEDKSYISYKAKKEKLGYDCDLEKGNGLLLTDNIFQNQINSVAILFIPYLTKENNQKTGNISNFARGKDYHIKIKQNLIAIIEELKNTYPNNFFHYQCDIGKINERYYAGVSGLCTIGLNSSLIHDKYGSYGNIALIYSDLTTKEYKTKIKHCPNCGLCKNNCPSKAIKENGMNNSRLCISYLTQKKEQLTKKEEKLIQKAGYIYGCDICQKICPMNKAIKFIKDEENQTINLEEKDLENLGNKEFKKKYKEKAFSWRGKAILLRNIKLLNQKS